MFILAGMIIAFAISCEYNDFEEINDYKQSLLREMRESERVVLGTDEDGNTKAPAYCDKAYSGPEGDIQVTSFCLTAYNYVCNSGMDPNSSEIKGICNTFNTMREGTSIGSCPYCK